MKLSAESVREHAKSDSEGWTLVVHPSGRIFLAQEGDDSYTANEFTSPSTIQSFPTAASVFGTPQTSIFGEVVPPVPPAPPPPGSFKFGSSSSKSITLAFGKNVDSKETKKEDSEISLFRFTSSSLSTAGEKSVSDSESTTKKDEDKSKDEKQKEEEEEGDVLKPPTDGPVFNIGIVAGSKEKQPRSKSPRRRRGFVSSSSKEKEDKSDDAKSVEDTAASDEKVKQPATPPAPPVAKRQALSPAFAECQRAVFAAFLWQEGLVHDAMASSLYLKFHPDTSKEDETAPKEMEADNNKDESDKSKDKVGVVLPSTLNHLVTFWDEISQKVLDSSSASFSPPKVPAFAQELQKRYEEEKKEMEKLKKEKEKKNGGGGALAGGGGGNTMCELCDTYFPDPVTYHMKDSHPGCGKHANGWGYNSRGSYCSGWAGNCGDGGRGGSTWYLMCKECHSKYLSMKEENKRKATKPVTVPKMKTRKPGKPRSLPVVSPVQCMTQNAKFLLEVASSSEHVSKRKSQTEMLRQISTPEDIIKDKTTSLPRDKKSKEAPLPSLRSMQHAPVFARSISVATEKGVEPMKRTFSDSGEDAHDAPPPLARQMTEAAITKEDASSSLMTKPSMSLAKLMYNRSCQSKDTGYSKVMEFVMCYYDLQGLRATMKQMMRLAYLRAFALEVMKE